MTQPISNHLNVGEITDTRSSRDAAPTKNRAESTSAEAVPATDQVTLTEDVDRIASAVRLAAQSPDVDAARVQSAREAIENGTFQVDPDRIAASLLELDSALGEKD